MASTFLLIVAAAVALYALKLYLQFAKHLREAKASGLPYVIVPFYIANRLYQVSCLVLLPIFRRLPQSWTESWLELTLDWAWTLRYQPFKNIGSDTFLVVSPERTAMYTADADVVSQIVTRRNDFPKPLEVYGTLRIYGENVVVVEGQRWRHHRKIVAPPFSEKNNALVWKETIAQTRAMVNGWIDPGRKESDTLTTIANDAMRLSLYIISRAGFGVALKWPAKGDENSTEKSEALENGHTMTYTDALGSLLHNILWLLAVPQGLLKILPFKTTKRAQKSFIEWGQYMSEMYAKKKTEVLSGASNDQLDLMIAMIKGANVTSDPSTQVLTDREILGNAFVFILAGHETTANSIHFALVYLALNITAQSELQRDLDGIFQGRPMDEWDYDSDLPKLFGGMAGAVMNEVLRLHAPVAGLPKSTPYGTAQTLNVNGKRCIIPPHTYIQFITTAIHRNPHQWPTGPPADPEHPLHPLSNTDNDLEEFKPERWLLDTEAKRTAAKEVYARLAPEASESNSSAAAAAALGVNTAPDTAANLYKPPKGAYIPFSEGYRSCIGRRFAQVELLAALAVVFTHYSIELAVDEWATDAEVDQMGPGDRRKVWEKARQNVEAQMKDDMVTVITLQLSHGHFALRLVRRGNERFRF